MDKNTQLNYINADITVKDTVYVYHKIREVGFTYKFDHRGSFGIAYVLRGSARFDFGYKKEIAKAGDVVFLRQGEKYTTEVIGDCDWDHIVISFKISKSTSADDLPFETVFSPNHIKRFEELFLKAKEIWDKCSVGYKIQVKSIINQIIFELIKQYSKQVFSEDIVPYSIKAAADYIELNYKEKVTVEKLASISGYSPSHFTRLFCKTYGVSPIEYLTDIRITHAKNMLKTNLYPISEIATLCGFSNVYYFSRMFKEKTGVTPKKY